MAVALTSISGTDLDLAAHLDAVSGPEQGALTSFVGTVRDHSPDAAGTVTQLEYVAHPDAEAVLSRIAGEVAAAYPQVTVAASHRTGTVAVGGLAIVVCVGAAHRVDVFDACRHLVERIKAELPMWKKQMLADGSHQWVGSA
ncbi:MAG TPA: molybdenum cofactor biosynthesis protein MoaE [Candidatus Ruania gallistercoris]|uniref:Molybdenum cofactor biosynthesis protein MoaE n=1 Tax=Candidatus Ruania gallistercoris TaxID=2838746 RepID=A0A9D2J5G6_9MICO|nr:molybdenum cofactor biosynthesis protein MoaE [Candidatus Ruania gallistercoris]